MKRKSVQSDINTLAQFLQKRRRFGARKHSAYHPLRHLLSGLGVQLVAFLKFTLDTGKQSSHASGDNCARWLDDDG